MILNFLYKEWRKLLLLLCMCLLYFFSYFQRIAAPGICFDELQRDFKASAAAITALGSIFLYVYGFAQFFIGMVADRFGGRRTMLFGAGVLVCASILFPLSHSLPMLYITRAIVAAGASTIFISLAKEIDSIFNPRHFAIWLGVSLFIGYSGGLIGTVPFERAVSHFGWRAAMLSAGIMCLFVLVITAMVFRKFRMPGTASVPPRTNYLGSVLRNPLTYPIAVCSAINFAIYFLFQAAIGKKILTDCCAVSSARAATIMFLMMIACMCAASLAGFIARLIGNRRKPIIMGGVFMTLITIIMLTGAMHGRPDYRMIGAGFIILGISTIMSPIALAVVKEVNISLAAATSMGIGNCAAYVVVAIITNLAGVVMDCFKEQTIVTDQGVMYPAAAYRLILAGCAVLAVCSAVAACFIRETKGSYLSSQPESPFSD